MSYEYKCKFIHNLNLFILFVFKILIGYSQECVQLIYLKLYIIIITFLVINPVCFLTKSYQNFACIFHLCFGLYKYFKTTSFSFYFLLTLINSYTSYLMYNYFLSILCLFMIMKTYFFKCE
jgi:hypothetical protein